MFVRTHIITEVTNKKWQLIGICKNMSVVYNCAHKKIMLTERHEYVCECVCVHLTSTEPPTSWLVKIMKTYIKMDFTKCYYWGKD